MLSDEEISGLQDRGPIGIDINEMDAICDQARRAKQLEEEVERLKHRFDSIDLDRAAALEALRGLLDAYIGEPPHHAMSEARTRAYAVLERCEQKEQALLRERE